MIKYEDLKILSNINEETFDMHKVLVSAIEKIAKIYYTYTKQKKKQTLITTE